MNKTRTERVTFHTEGGRSRTIYLEQVREMGLLLTGIEVDKTGDEVAPRGVDERRHIIALELVTKRTPVRMDNIYGEYVDAEEVSR